jgi:hypothetical protein
MFWSPLLLQHVLAADECSDDCGLYAQIRRQTPGVLYYGGLSGVGKSRTLIRGWTRARIHERLCSKLNPGLKQLNSTQLANYNR